MCKLMLQKLCVIPRHLLHVLGTAGAQNERNIEPGAKRSVKYPQGMLRE
jgi:hypothetical protein